MNAPSTFGPDYQLLWPKLVFAAEAVAIAKLPANDDMAAWLLEESFFGGEPLEQFRGSNQNIWGATPLPSGRDFLRNLANNVDQLPDEPAQYWITRKAGKVPDRKPLTSDQLQDQWRRMVSDFEKNGYFARIAPEECVDGDPGDPAETIRAEVLRRTGLAVNWPQQTGTAQLDEDTFLTLVEVIHDLTARPRTRNYHSYADCGWHYSDFAIKTGQGLYRAKVNDLLRSAQVELQLADSGSDVGRLVRVAVDGRQDLVEMSIQRASDGNNSSSSDGGDVLHAMEQFRSRGATRQDKKLACVNLAGVLERRRKALKQDLLSKDEGALFQIANQFALRHQNADQRADYTDDYLDWIFWTNLATIELTDRLAARSTASTGTWFE